MAIQDFLRRFTDKVWKRPNFTVEQVEAFYDEGEELIEEGRFQDALKIAKTLKRCRYTGAFEIEAKALNGMGRTNKAIASLRAGLSKKPVWSLGHLLGIYLSDEGHYEDAIEAFVQSDSMWRPRPRITAYNIAIVHDRAGRPDEALRLVRDLLAEPDVDGDEDLREHMTAFATHLEGEGVD